MRARGEQLEASLQAEGLSMCERVIFFVNGGDPSPAVSCELLRTLHRHGSSIVELCVPFPNSITDGPVIRESHRRALAAGVTLDSVLEQAQMATSELGLQVVLLADYMHSVAPVGMCHFLRKAREAGVAATLIHGLPASQRAEYVERSAELQIGRVMSFFVRSSQMTQRAAYAATQGFVYVVSQFGRTGVSTGFDPELLSQIRQLCADAPKPLAVGFGVKTAQDVTNLHEAGARAAIVGSAATAVIARHLDEPTMLLRAFDNFVESILSR
jgi:tryptophan synthase alpha chain